MIACRLTKNKVSLFVYIFVYIFQFLKIKDRFLEIKSDINVEAILLT